MNAPSLALHGKRVVVTGAGGGIGGALLQAFGAAGATLIACDRAGAGLDALDVAGRVSFDLADPRGIDEAAAALLATHGAPDILINNAGFTRGETLRSTDADLADHELQVNLGGVLRFTQALLPRMAKAGGGAVVFVSSVNALTHVGNPAYAAAKAGIQAYCRAIAVEYGRAGIRANAVCPGSVRTPAWDHRLAKDPEVVARTARFYPLGRLVEPAEVANAVLFLASPLAAAITGVALAVDAGLSAGNLDFVETVLGH